eukprot:13237219-Alexandrium_andersonii.AAC.1
MLRDSACTAWDLYIAMGPKCNPQSAQGPPVLQSASIRNPPYIKYESLHAFEPRTARAKEQPPK